MDKQPTTTTTTLTPSAALNSHPFSTPTDPNDTIPTATSPPTPTRQHSLASTFSPSTLHSFDTSSIHTDLTELPSYHHTGRIPTIGLAANYAFPETVHLSMVQDWHRSGVDFNVVFAGTERMVLRLEGKVWGLRHCVEFLTPSTRAPCLLLRQDIPGIGLDFSLFAPSPSPSSPHNPSSTALAHIVVRSGTLAGKPFRNSLSLSFPNLAAQPWQDGSSTAKERKVVLRLDTRGKRAVCDVVLVGGDEVGGGRGEGGEVVVAKIRRVLVSSEERVDMVVGAGVDVRLVVALAACLKYRRRE